MNAHSWYERQAVEISRDVQILVRRLICKSCKKTISLLPSFVLRHRHYTLGTQEAVIETRVREGQPWSRAGPASEPHSGPCLRTRQRWVKAFQASAAAWLGALQVLLAAVRPAAQQLDAHARQDDVFACMLAAADWLARGRDIWQTVWCWGWNTGVGRLT